MRDWLVPAVATFVIWGFWAFLPKLTVDFISPRSALVYQVIGGAVLALLLLPSLGFRLELHPRGSLLAIATGFLGYLGALTFLIAAARGRLALVASISALYPGLAILLSLVFLRETISLRQGAGVLLALVAMLLVAF